MSKQVDQMRREENYKNSTSLHRVNSTQNCIISRKEFTANDVISICSDIANKEGIMVEMPVRKASLLRRFSADFSKRNIKSGKFSNAGSDSTYTSEEASPITPVRRKSGQMSSHGDGDVITDDILLNGKSDKGNIPGLRGRDIVAIAILVDSKGAPMKTYTEWENIPTEEYEAANHIYISRVPFPENSPNKRASLPNAHLYDDVLPSTNDINVKSLSDVLAKDIDVMKANKLKRRMSNILIKLHTTDVSTAKSFLKAKRFANVRKEIKTELLTFVEKDLKKIIVNQYF